MEENNERFLPIGSVVILKEAKKRIMIIGFGAKSKSDADKIWDYIGCLYPEGLLDSNQTLLFDHEQIDKIFYKGLVDEEEIAFKKKLNGILKLLDTQSDNFSNLNNEENK